jgi:xylulokinase
VKATGPCVLAIDLGTSGCKGAVVSLQGRVLGAARVPVETIHLPGGGAEQDPERVWSAVRTACREAVGGSSVDTADVRAVICTSQYSSVVPVDVDGRPTANMILWLDRRGAPDRLRRLPGFPRGTDSPLRLLRWLRVHGLPPVAGGLTLAHLRYVKYELPDVYERTATFLEPTDYVSLRLTGRATANACTAFMFLVTDNRRPAEARYDARLVRYAGIDPDKLPPLVPVDAIVGTVLPDVASEIGVSPETPVITGLNDTQAGAVATAAFQGSHAAISLGSTSVMITHVPGKRTDLRHAILSMPSPVPDTFFVMAENGAGAGGLDHLLDELDPAGTSGADERYARLERTVEQAPAGSGGVLYLPWMGGSMAPRADGRMRGGFLNVGLATTRAELARAVLEGIALNLRWLRAPVERFARRRFSHFVLYGGGAASDAWSQILADVLDAPVHQAERPQYVAAMGAALLAFQRIGLLGFDDFAGRLAIRRVYEPDPANRTMYEARAAQFVRAFSRTRPLFRALNDTEADR